MSRPVSQHRASTGAAAAVAAASSLPRSSYTRSHSHSVSLGSLNASHRVSRRKSSSFVPLANAAAAVAAAVAAAGASVDRPDGPTPAAAFSSINNNNNDDDDNNNADHPNRPPSNASAIVDGPSLSSFHALEKSSKPKVRRASDGTRLVKKEKPHPAAAGDLKCEHCGKAYKHGSCLNKHLWEHTPQWQLTSKLLISKHQQVQLLEAASVLVAMNQDAKEGDSDNSSASPAASGSSDQREDDLSSAETTPPPANAADPSKRYSANSSAYSRSYQSIFSDAADSSSFFFGNSHNHHRQWSTSSNRPTTGHTSIAESYRDEDPADLAAAVGLLSCSYGTPKHGPTAMPLDDVPPVPPLPAKYQSLQPSAINTSFAAHYRGGNRRDGDDVDMDDDGDDDDEGGYGGETTRHHDHHDIDEGMFGRMDA